MSLFEERCRKLDELLGIDSSYDISKREIEIDNKKAYIYFMPFLVNSGEIIELFFGFYMTDGSCVGLDCDDAPLRPIPGVSEDDQKKIKDGNEEGNNKKRRNISCC